MVLSDVSRGTTVHLICCDLPRDLRGRLTSMGLIPGAAVTVDTNDKGRPLLIRMDDSRLSLCRKLARHIQVSANGRNLMPSDLNTPLPECAIPDKEAEPPSECGHFPAPHNNQKKKGWRKEGCRRVCLRQMSVNQTGTIRSVRADGELGRRIREMGLVPDTEVTIVGRAPLRDPVALRLRDFTLSLRNNEADFITVDVDAAEEDLTEYGDIGCPDPEAATKGECRPGDPASRCFRFLRNGFFKKRKTCLEPGDV